MEIGTVLASQLQASLTTLENSLSGCPDAEWDACHGDAPFSQVAFHALFYCDFYLSGSEQEFRNQEFHRDNKAFFDDYEELEDRIPAHLYSRAALEKYLAFCRKKAGTVVPALDAAQLEEPPLMRRSLFSRMELFIYLTRHIQHHAAQLGLRMQLLTGREMKWVSRG